jgi:hypothetical protein
MRTLRLTLAFGLLAVCILVCLWAAGLIGQEIADESLRRTLFIIGAVGAALSLIYGRLFAKSKPPSGRR